MKKIALKILLIIILITLVGCTYNVSYSYMVEEGGTGSGGSSIQQDPIQNPNYFNPGKLETDETFENMLGGILGAIQVIGTIIAVVVISLLGIRYMMGSVEEKAEYKKTMVPYVIGAVLVFAIPSIVSALYDIAQRF